jgi:hypothetical protein
MKIITFAKHENRENLILRNSRSSRKFRETREHFCKFRVSRKSWKEFHQKPYHWAPLSHESSFELFRFFPNLWQTQHNCASVNLNSTSVIRVPPEIHCRVRPELDECVFSNERASWTKGVCPKQWESDLNFVSCILKNGSPFSKNF